MKMYQGVVEDVNDPLKLGRVRVRVFGLHTDDTNLIPTETLPWAMVMQSPDSASMSGIGFSAVGLLQGSWVVLFFHDPDEQYPVIIGSLHGVPKDSSAQVTADEEQSFEYSDNEAVTEQNVLKDGNGNTVTDSAGAPIATAPVVDVVPTGKVDPNKLGSVSAKYESNGNPATINTANYKTGKESGGAQYGAWQLASYLNSPTQPAPGRKLSDGINSPVWQFIKFAGLTQFNGLSPATDVFDSTWKAWANSNKVASHAIQHKYIEQVYYQSTIAKLPQHIVSRGAAVHEMIWSMAVQLGQAGAARKIKATVGNFESSVCDHVIVDTVYSARLVTLQSDFKSSPGLWDGLVKRFNDEKKQLIALAKTYQTGNCASTVTTTEEKKVVYKETEKQVVTETVTKAAPVSSKGKRGFVDPSGTYPTQYNEPDTHRLARGILTGTIVERKRSEVVSGKEAGDGSITEPTTQYNTKYPHNKVFVTPSGHIIELDDTPGYERVHVYHKSGTFVEMYPDGRMVTKVKGDNTLVVNSNDNTIVLGDQNTSIDGNSNSTVTGNIRLVVNGDINTTVYGNVTMDVTGNTAIKSTRIDLN